MMTAAEIRRTFLEFFQNKSHTIVPSAPITVKNDPTLMFTNAGMNQFKDIFLGNKPPACPRVADTQKCLRVSGKHNDLEEVGTDTYHHTMFEMLGNWSFGDYFKEEAIAWAWELLTEVYQIPKEQLYVTVFGGDEKENLSPDQEARACWGKHIARDRILPGSKKDNFWEMGDTGPCGPCSEIHVDCRSAAEREETDGRELVNAGHPQVIEIWNLVFMEFNRLNDGVLKPLPARHVDTGMGLERLVRVLQGKNSNYDTDLFTPLIRHTEKLTGLKYAGGDSNTDVAFRVIADHVRAICFTIADGQLPSNTGAGYVIRRILRRAVRYYFSFLGIKAPLLYKLIDPLAAQFDNVFPGLEQQKDFLKKVIMEEESGFLRTLDSGMKRMEEYFSGDRKEQALDKTVDGRTAFELYDTFGFPLDLTRLIARERGYLVDEKGFGVEMQKQKNRSRQATATDTEDWVTIHDVPRMTFVGYDDLLVDTRVVKYRGITSKNRRQYQIVLETTPFYGESGGQVGDTGTLMIGNTRLEVTDTKKENDLIIHLTGGIAEDMHAGVTARVDAEKRLRTMSNHSATHLLHAALKEVLGKHVNQKGSLVNPEVLRFDVSHFAKISDQQLHETESLVNEKIRENIPVVIRELPKQEALKLGAMALFGEKYGDRVRVVTMDPRFSIELCGGTHVGHTGMIGLFTITSESAVAAGVRRIEALTGGAAIRYVTDKITQHKAISELLKAKEPLKAVEKLLEDKAALEKQAAASAAKELSRLSDMLAKSAEPLGGLSFIGKVVEVPDADALKQLCFQLKPRFTTYGFILAADLQGKAAVALMLDDATAAEKNLDAAGIIREKLAPLIRGGGGGQKTFATAGGKDISRLGEVVETVKNILAGRASL
ncbi:MAG TPA: alanine--tRNA ligase [Chitinophagaceae bacterium]|nr:alanine--tRNA ligase [Chitinophagaceae bacterium]